VDSNEDIIITDTNTLKILAVDTRIEILKELKKGNRTLSDLSRILKKDKSTIMEHLVILTKAGLVRRIQNPGKKFVFYALTEKGSGIFVEKQKGIETWKSRTVTMLLVAFVGVLLVGLSVIYYNNITGSTAAKSRFPQTHIQDFLKINLSASSFSMNKTAELTITITSNTNKVFSNVTAGVILPNGIELVSGNMNWSGDIPPNGTIRLNAIIKATKSGDFVIKAYAKGIMDGTQYYTENKLNILLTEH
jgi:DNA-binding transcriptional ArsR family regulator